MKHVMQNRIHLFSLPSVGPGPTATPPAPPIHSSLLSVLLRQCFNVVSVFLFRTHSHNCRRTVSHRRTSHSPPTTRETFSLDHRYFSHKMNTEPTPYIVRVCYNVIQFFGTVNVIGASFGVQ